MPGGVDTHRKELTFRVHPDLRFLLAPQLRATDSFIHQIERKASIKDVIESLGIPHTEIGRLTVQTNEVDFSCHVQDGDIIEVDRFTTPVDVTEPSCLRPEPLKEIRFLVDANVGRLAKLLRMTGIDTAYNFDWPDAELAQKAAEEKRILLTRDRALLRYGSVTFGHLVRAIHPEDQLVEVVRFYGLQGMLKPFSRCMRCNGLLHSVDKARIDHLLEPLTRIHYKRFHQCGSCEQVYWEGSHKEGMESVIEKILET